MANQYIWVGIAVGVFFAGIGIGYAILQPQPNFMNMSPQQMQQMMNNPGMMNQWHQTMMNNPQAMNSWMNKMMSNPQTMNQMMDTMMQNPQFGNWMMGSMMSNQNTMNNVMNQMMQNPQFMNRWMGQMMTNQNFQQQYMGPYMMMRDPQFMQNMRSQFSQTDIGSLAVETDKVSILADTWQYQSTKSYSPAVIKVSKGTTVTWTNEDQIIHTVTDLGNKFDSGFIQSQESWQYTFDEQDNYLYFCSIHPWMRGTVLVS